ncbi:MAG: ice-binding family protein [Coriobacteriia bacterium]
MQSSKRTRFVSLLLALSLTVVMALPATSMAAEPTVNLGSTASFAILAGETITNTGPTTINGDVGVHPGSTFTGQGDATINGAIHLADAVALTAKTDLVTAYNDASSRALTASTGVELGGLTLGPGVYESGGALGLTGTLTLDAGGDPDAVFIFRSTSTLITAPDSSVVLTNSARFCRVFWVVPSSATLGTNSEFVGHIFAMTSIEAHTGATVQGQLLARNGAVTLDTNTITNGLCAAQTVPGIQITKSASPTALTSGPGTVTYTYRVTNPGNEPLSNVVVTDNKLSSVAYVSGDVNGDDLLQSGETWVYTSTTRLTATTTNIATVHAMSGETAVTDTASVRVAVGTVTGGQIPRTATPWYNILLAGGFLMLLGAVGFWRTTRRIHA